ncbi:MAG: (d)CMP kinase [Acidobacteria bacterium]|nr:(d)CMP kinase [Acidobacteriota bacterium]
MNFSDKPLTSVPPIIAIDGPAGAGKSSVAIRLAAFLGLPYLDTGAMYRAVGLMAHRQGWRPPLDPATDGPKISRLAEGRLRLVPEAERMRVWVDHVEVTDEIRSPECSAMASAVSALSEVRRALVPEQRRMGLLNGGVMEGRDIGSVVFPDAALKVFLTASPRTRAERRYRELTARGLDVSLEEVLKDQSERDLRDSSRADSPLQVASGAVVVDTSGMELDEVVERLAALFLDVKRPADSASAIHEGEK